MAVSYRVCGIHRTGFKVKFTSPERYFLVSFRIRLARLSGYMIYIIGVCWTNGARLGIEPNEYWDWAKIPSIENGSDIPSGHADLYLIYTPNSLKVRPNSLHYLLLPDIHQSWTQRRERSILMFEETSWIWKYNKVNLTDWSVGGQLRLDFTGTHSLRGTYEAWNMSVLCSRHPRVA